ncbi:O-antigen ligase family protein [Rhodococcus sp. IEGM 1379]|uniref:O-antigen ligase family protein n=1 Tax=Rhodococcus sp. IEGM 1379 TaxID=3047086 RepID=UPI0024B70DCA|nr:O-antigen ligase family protein [Rhodococcus sp. IEGM 1379]MDI9915079.1 O-antigen ligase family protein [Rhodococcus sp. IEGM 1379]
MPTQVTPVKTDISLAGKIGAASWIGIAAILPIYRLIMTDMSALLPYVVLALLVACTLLGQVRTPINLALWILMILTIPMAAAVSGTSTSVIASSYVGVKLALFVGLTPFVLRHFIVTDKNFLRRALTAFVGVQSLSAAAGLVQLTGVNIVGRSANSGRANGLAVHPNVLGIMCTLAMLICIAALTHHLGRTRLLLCCLILLNAAALVATGSLSSMLAAAAGLCVLLVCMRVTAKAVILLVAGATVALFGLTLFGYDTNVLTGSVEERVNVVTGASNDGVASLSIRQATYDFAWQYIKSDPLIGVGMNSTNEGTFDGKTVVHNYLLHGWYQGGILLIAVFVALTVAMTVLVLRCIATGSNSVAAATITAMLTFAATSAFYDQQQYWLPILVAVATVNPVRKVDPRPHGERTHPAIGYTPRPGGRVAPTIPRPVAHVHTPSPVQETSA